MGIKAIVLGVERGDLSSKSKTLRVLHYRSGRCVGSDQRVDTSCDLRVETNNLCSVCRDRGLIFADASGKLSNVSVDISRLSI